MHRRKQSALDGPRSLGTFFTLQSCCIFEKYVDTLQAGGISFLFNTNARKCLTIGSVPGKPRALAVFECRTGNANQIWERVFK